MPFNFSTTLQNMTKSFYQSGYYLHVFNTLQTVYSTVSLQVWKIHLLSLLLLMEIAIAKRIVMVVYINVAAAEVQHFFNETGPKYPCICDIPLSLRQK